MLALINAERCNNGLPPLALNGTLNSAATQHSIDMALRDVVTNAASDGSTVEQRMQAAGYRPVALAGQNVWGGVADAGSAFGGILGANSANILNPDLRDLGVGHVRRDGTANVHFWTLVFGSTGSPPGTCP